MSHRIRIGFEVFPPKSGSSETFESSVATLAAVGDYVSVTYGASGSGRERSETAINALVAQGHANKIAAHLTASSQSKDQIDRLARDWKAKGI
ncbi:MAG TPA: methylenetetrahydrofolate reductase [NAD(P)H], partial [Rhodospirillaceae bacterium]|nr:methylenetetrahydrofolate reductase [NAD(P)H] [Rhodospirillaceae bacterium]